MLTSREYLFTPPRPYQLDLNSFDVEDRLQMAVEHSERGEPWTEFMRQPRAVLLHDSELIQKVLVRNRNGFTKDVHPFRVLKPLLTTPGAHALGLAQERVASAREALDELVATASREFTHALRTHALQAVTTLEVDLFPALSKSLFVLMGKVLFDASLEVHAEEFFMASMRHEDFLAIRRRRENARQLSQSEQKEFSCALEAQDAIARVILTRFPQEKRESLEAVPDISPERALIRTLLNSYAGSATTLWWSLLMLAQHPAAQADLAQQICLKSVDARTSVKAWVQETLRLYPAAWMISRRVAPEGDSGGPPFLPGTHVFICPYTVHRSPQFWKCPEQFDLGRFLPPRDSDIAPASYLPFGIGPAACPGSRLAMQILVAYLYPLVRDFTWALKSGCKLTPFPRVALRPNPSVSVHVALRSSARV